MRIMILEDEIHRAPRNAILSVLAGHRLVVATNILDAMKIYSPGGYDLLLLDHDMHGYYQNPDDEDTGYQFVKWLVIQEVNPRKPPVILHSQNQMGRRAMCSHLFQSGFRVMEKPFSSDYIKYLKENIAL